MENFIYKEILLPEHESAVGTRVCHVCHGVMNPSAHEHTFNLPRRGAKVKVSGIQAYQCAACGEIVYSHEEVGRIESAIHDALS